MIDLPSIGNVSIRVARVYTVARYTNQQSI